MFLSGLAVARHLDGLLCHAYCLMENHYHLLVETPRANLDDAMQRLNGTYAMRFNRHHERTGHVFQGRYGAKLITDDDYALTVVRYIAANPVQAGSVCSARGVAVVELRRDRRARAAASGSSRRRCSSWFADSDEYRRFVAAGLAEAQLEEPPIAGAISCRHVIRTRIADAHERTATGSPRSPTIWASIAARSWRDVRRYDSA